MDMEIQFSPMEVLDDQVQLIVHKSTGGRWRFDLELHASSPTPNGTILIESPINETTFFPMKLYSSYSCPEAFTTAFALDSSPNFVVEPIQVRGLSKSLEVN